MWPLGLQDKLGVCIGHPKASLLLAAPQNVVAEPRVETDCRVESETASCTQSILRMVASSDPRPAPAASLPPEPPCEAILSRDGVGQRVDLSRCTYKERCRRIEKVAGRLFEGKEAVLHVIERIVAPLGLRVDESSPWVDARLSDGSRVQTRFLNT
jgi:hypothetical protein